VRADRTGKHECLSSSDEAALTEAEAAAKALLEKEERLCLSSLAIKGDDLLALGYRGSDIGNALHKALDALLSGRVKNEKEALIHMLEKEKNAPPIECERKFLIRRPDEALLRSMGAQASNITQTYLLAEPGVTERVRARVFSDKTVYTHTKKVRISALSATEDEKEVSHEDYERLLKRSDPSRTPLQKTRYTLPSGKHLLEMDLFPFWEKQAVLEIELSAEDETFTIPDFIFVLREVTGEAAYKNVHLAKQVPAEEA
jgi:CYTH domain-containing protein